MQERLDQAYSSENIKIYEKCEEGLGTVHRRPATPPRHPGLSTMQTASASGLLFCPYTGSMLVFDPLKNTASSKLSGYTRQLDGGHGCW